MSRSQKSDCIYKRKDGRFEGRYIASRDEKGKAKYASVYGKSPEEVRCKLAKAREGSKEMLPEKGCRYQSFAEAASAWLADRKHSISPSSYERYERLVNKYVLPEIGDRALSAITYGDINAMVASFADKGQRGERALRGGTLENIQSIGISVLNFALQPMQGAKPLAEFVEIQKNACQPLSPGEIQRLVACAAMHHCPEMLGVLLVLYTGIGTGELCALSWDDVNLERQEIFIRHTLYRLKNTGDAGEGIRKTRLSVTDVHKSHIRTAVFPVELKGYMEEFHKNGTYFLTCEKNHLMEQKTLGNRIDRLFSQYELGGVTLQRVNRTFKEGLADPGYLRESASRFPRPVPMRPDHGRIDEQWLLEEMKNDMGSLRMLLGLDGDYMGEMLGLSKRAYLDMEAGREAMDWPIFLSLLFFYRYNRKTEAVVDALGLYPDSLKRKIALLT